MINILKQAVLCVAILAGFVVTLQSFQGNFKTFWPGKQIRISKSSQKFLSQVIPWQQDLFAYIARQSVGIARKEHEIILVLLQLTCSWIGKDSIPGSDIDRFGQLVFSFKEEIARTQKRNFVLAGGVLKVAPNAVCQIACFLAKEIKQVYISTAQADLQQIGLFLKQSQDGSWDSSRKTNALLIFGIAQDIIRHFDGVSVTEYDFMVLSQCILFTQLLIGMG